MSHIQRQIRINAPKTHVWEALADFGGVYKYSPGVIESKSTTEANEGVGAARVCQLAPMGAVEERILTWREGESYSLEIFDGKKVPPFKHAIATISLQSTGPNDTLVNIDFDYALKYGPIGAVMNLMMVRTFLDKGFAGLLAGLKHYAETGETVDGSTKLNFSAVATPA